MNEGKEKWIKTSDEIVDKPLSIRALRAIARIIRSFCELDYCLSTALYKASGMDEEVGAKTLGKLSFSSKREKFAKLLKREAPNSLKEIWLVMENEIISISEFRNAVAHGMYSGMQNTTIQKNSGEFLVFSLTSFTSEEIYAQSGFAIKTIKITEDNLVEMVARVDRMVREFSKLFRVDRWSVKMITEDYHLV